MIEGNEKREKYPRFQITIIKCSITALILHSSAIRRTGKKAIRKRIEFIFCIIESWTQDDIATCLLQRELNRIAHHLIRSNKITFIPATSVSKHTHTNTHARVYIHTHTPKNTHNKNKSITNKKVNKVRDASKQKK